MGRLACLLIIIITFFTAFAVIGTVRPAFAHFFGGKIQSVGGYDIAFVPNPSSPLVGSNSTVLNFSVLKDNYNINNVYAAALIIEKSSNKTIAQFPYRFYEFSDISIPYVFMKPAVYEIVLQVRIAGDEKYQATPLTASFDIIAIDPGQIMPFDMLMLFYVTPASLSVAGVAVYLHLKQGKFKKRAGL